MSLHATNRVVDASTLASSGIHSGPGFGEDHSGTMSCEWREPGNQLGQMKQGLQDGSD